MLANVHLSTQQLLARYAALPALVDVRFEMPTKQWVGSLTRPTVCFFMYDVQENIELRQANPHAGRANGQAMHRLPPRRFELRYMVSAISSVAEDEYQLLWRILAILLKHPELPAVALPEDFRGQEPPLPARIGRPDDAPRALELWNALDLPPRPAIFYTVTAPLDLEIEFSAPLVLSTITHFTTPPVGGELDPHVVTKRDPETGAPLDGLALASTRTVDRSKK